jgi:hypothetical protein
VHVLSALRAAECDVCDSRIENFVADRTFSLDRFATLLQALLEVLGCVTEEVRVNCKVAVHVADFDTNK